MNWFFIALGAPVLYAFVNIADQYLIAKYSNREKERSSGGLVIFSSLIGLFIAVIILSFTPDVLHVSLHNVLLLFLAGALTVVWIVLYLYALEIEEVSRVVPWFLSIPVFGYILGYLFLGETLTRNQILGSFVIFAGLVLISINFHEEKKGLKKKPVFYMIFCSLVVAVSGIIFKYVTVVERDFWVSSFWEYLGLGIAGLLIYLFVPKHREEFKTMNRIGGRKIFLVNFGSEIVSVAGNLLTNFALLLAPVAMIFLVGSFQPAIVLILTVLGTKFFPHIIKENITMKALIPKIIAIAVITAGSVMLFL